MKERLQKINTLVIDCILQIFQYQATAIGRNIEIVADLFQSRGDICQHLIGQQQLPRGEQHQLLNRLQGALRQWIKGAQGFGGIAKKLDSDRRRQVGGEYIEDSSPDGKCATVLDQRHICIAHPDQTGEQIISVELFSRENIAG